MLYGSPSENNRIRVCRRRKWGPKAAVVTTWGVLAAVSLHWFILSNCTGLGPQIFPDVANHKYLNNEHTAIRVVFILIHVGNVVLGLAD